MCACVCESQGVGKREIEETEDDSHIFQLGNWVDSGTIVLSWVWSMWENDHSILAMLRYSALACSTFFQTSFLCTFLHYRGCKTLLQLESSSSRVHKHKT